ncbi:integrase catalytic domain-containing protein [Trichonephila clavipes]|uniref:Integrase catalytic domain-containing protein n=1 Tax=Trichonephila clavipes TaxID=2585209 RepID=A0A8X6W2D0_TRICX|nr:integrase catalytic domain-containing protein [Trichonephila clavipes]
MYLFLLLVGLCKSSLLDKAPRKLGHLCEQQGTKNTSIATNPEDWKHIPGILNPADLPSRGCGVVELIASLWWEGPSWLNKPREEWPLSEACPDRAIIDSERKRTVASTINPEPKEMDYLSEISSFKKIIRVTAWIYRFYHNLRKQRNDRNFGELITQETDAAERKVLKIVQKQSFSNDTKSLVSQMQTLVDSDGIIRIKSKIIMRKDVESIRYPIVLPSRHPIVTLIIQKHIELLHAGVKTVMSALRENYWILKSRKTVRRVLSECIICKRFTVKPLTTLSPPLPEDRVREAQIFEITGVDLCGPLFLRDRKKSWIVQFFAQYIWNSLPLRLPRASYSLSEDLFHVEVVLSLFIQIMERIWLEHLMNLRTLIGRK